MDSCKERNDFTNRFWSYYRMLESDCLKLRRYIEFRDENLKTCSNEIIKQLLSTAAEFDNVCKFIIEKEDKDTTLLDYKKWFFSKDCDIDIKKVIIVVKNSNMEIAPFSTWGGEKNDKLWWWDNYNSIKHHRDNSYVLGSLDCLLYALAALYFLECYCYKRISQKNSTDACEVFDVPPDLSELFYIKSEMETHTMILGDNLFGVG